MRRRRYVDVSAVNCFVLSCLACPRLLCTTMSTSCGFGCFHRLVSTAKFEWRSFFRVHCRLNYFQACSLLYDLSKCQLSPVAISAYPNKLNWRPSSILWRQRMAVNASDSPATKGELSTPPKDPRSAGNSDAAGKAQKWLRARCAARGCRH